MTAAATQPRRARTPLHVTRTLLHLVQFEHTIFALPFAYAGALIAAHGNPGWSRLAWITLAMAGARSCAFALNRLVDRTIDSRNPRTAQRPSVTGEVTTAAMLALALVSALLLAVAAANLNRLCLVLCPIPLALFVLYPYCKRFTFLAHFVLGAGIAGAPVGGFLAVRGAWDLPAVLLGLSVLFWMGGLDILYALQDVEVDRSQGLHSVPSRLGIRNAFYVSDLSHAATAAFLVATGIAAHLAWPYWLGAAAGIALLVYEHSLVAPTDFSRVNRAFFTVNSYFAVAVFCGVLAAVAVH
ncbi:MAG TPA: UbiA-like polyprenyltransferase [Candidatus Dormibacteraeota bacterium]|nr:UbiA-like polyprenyltransferase [Candidatus Dormibacteraeota bacterium]